jgi:hypothetical protein
MIGLLVVLIALLPTLIAFRREHERRIEITFLNLLAGWTGIGWVVALAWATGRKPSMEASSIAAAGARRKARYLSTDYPPKEKVHVRGSLPLKEISGITGEDGVHGG